MLSTSHDRMDVERAQGVERPTYRYRKHIAQKKARIANAGKGICHLQYDGLGDDLPEPGLQTSTTTHSVQQKVSLVPNSSYHR